MATTSITDLAYVPQVFNDYVMAQVMKKSEFFTSQAVVSSSLLVPTYGDRVNVPAWNGLTGTANVLSDSVCQTPVALTSHNQKGAILERGKVWSVNGLVESFAGSNPLDMAAPQVATFWQRDIEAAMINSAKGAYEALDALSAGTIIKDISAAATTGAIINGADLIKARALGGEYMRDYTILVVHPDVYAVLHGQNLTQFIPNSEGVPFESYMGMQIVVTSTLAPVSDVYDTLLVKPGAFGYAEFTDPVKGLEFDRDIKCNDDLMSVQKRYVIHPMGASFTGSIAGATATNAELATAAKWALGGPDKEYFGIRVLRHKVVANP